jgi:hypothetical protein
MSSLAKINNILAGIEADITDAERFLAEGLTAVIVLLKRGEDTREAENRVRDIRFSLETLRGLRRKHVRAGVVPAAHQSPNAHRQSQNLSAVMPSRPRW